MVKFVIAGSSDCPYLAKSELLGDVLEQSFESFSIKKEIHKPEAWEDWIEQKSKIKKINRKKSPVIWRELADRGGDCLLLGGYNEFWFV